MGLLRLSYPRKRVKNSTLIHRSMVNPYQFYEEYCMHYNNSKIRVDHSGLESRNPLTCKKGASMYSNRTKKESRIIIILWAFFGFLVLKVFRWVLD